VNANDVALFLILGMPLGLPIVMPLLFTIHRNLKGLLQQLINLLYMPLSVFSIVLTGSRTSLVAIIPFGFFMIGTQRIKVEHKILISVLLLVSLLALLPLIPPVVLQRIGTIGASIRGADLGGRVAMWRKGIAVLAQHPIFGVGSGAVDRLIGGNVHNTFITIATETGFIGLVLFLAILGLVVYAAIMLPKNTSALWMSIFLTWLIGSVSMSWEFRKVTWIILSFVMIESSFGKQGAQVEEKRSFPERRPAIS
jgi:O-antigen ligase